MAWKSLEILDNLSITKFLGSKPSMNKHVFIDLFAGCGGLSMGLEQAGFTPVFVNELNPDAMETYLQNRRKDHPWLDRYKINDVKELVRKEGALIKAQLAGIRQEFGLDDVDLVVGGPPCQGFSGIGHRRSYSVDKEQLPSNHLYQDYAYVIHVVRPKIFLFENVRGLLNAKWNSDGKNGEIWQDVLETLRGIPGYEVRWKLVYAKDYGVPQNRPRVLAVGVRKDIASPLGEMEDAVLAGFLPLPTRDYPNPDELFSDLVDEDFQYGGSTSHYLRDPQNAVQKRLRRKRNGRGYFAAGDELTEQDYSKHSPKVQAKFRAMLESGGEIPEEFRTKKFAQRLLPREWGEDGPTITATSLPDDYVHYCQARSLTVREWARLQMFPDWYRFSGKRTTGGIRRAGNPREGIFDREVPKYTQIGNAVPVKLAYEVGRHFMEMIKR